MVGAKRISFGSYMFYSSSANHPSTYVKLLNSSFSLSDRFNFTMPGIVALC